jgi:hypothetical protein
VKSTAPTLSKEREHALARPPDQAVSGLFCYSVTGNSAIRANLQIEIHRLREAALTRSEVDEDVAGMHGMDAGIWILRTTLVADGALADIAEARRWCDLATCLAARTATMRISGCLRP